MAVRVFRSDSLIRSSLGFVPAVRAVAMDEAATMRLLMASAPATSMHALHKTSVCVLVLAYLRFMAMFT